MIGRAAALVVLLGCARAAAAQPAGAAVVDIGPAHLIVDDGWRVTDPGAGAGAGAASGSTSFQPIVLRGPDGAVLVLTRMPVGNLPAWSRATRDEHVAALVAGFTAVDGTTVARQAVGSDGPSAVPVLDLALTRARRPVAVRVILFRTLTVAAAATADRDTPAVRAALARATAGLHADR